MSPTEGKQDKTKFTGFGQNEGNIETNKLVLVFILFSHSFSSTKHSFLTCIICIHLGHVYQTDQIMISLGDSGFENLNLLTLVSVYQISNFLIFFEDF